MKEKQTNYKAMFFSGITFLGVGIVFMASVNAGLGAAFIVIGIALMVTGGKNKDKWKKMKKKHDISK